MRIGYARCSTKKQDLTVQTKALLQLRVSSDRIYTDHGFTGRNRARPGLDQALAAVRAGDTLVVSTVHDPTDPMGKLFFNILATFAEFESDLIRHRTREGMAVARAKGKLRGKQPKLSELQQKELVRMRNSGEYGISDLAELFSVSRPTVYRTIARQEDQGSPSSLSGCQQSDRLYFEGSGNISQMVALSP